MTPEMLDKSTATAAELRSGQAEFGAGLAEVAPVDDGWADVVLP